MGINAIRQAVEKRFLDNWTGTDKKTTIRFSNRPFSPPKLKSWLSLDVNFADSNNSAISGRMTRRNGLIFCEIYAPIDKGSGDLTTLVDGFISIFENNQFDNIQCLSAKIRHIGVPNIQGTDPQWYVYRVSIPFYSYE